MIPALDIKVYSNDQATLNTLIGSIPPKEDPRVREEAYEGPVQRRDDVTGHQLLTASIKFHTEEDRLDVEGEIFENPGLFDKCLKGTKIKRRNSDHDISSTEGCTDVIVFEVV